MQDIHSRVYSAFKVAFKGRRRSRAGGKYKHHRLESRQSWKWIVNTVIRAWYIALTHIHQFIDIKAPHGVCVHAALYSLGLLQLHIALITNKVICCLDVSQSIVCLSRRRKQALHREHLRGAWGPNVLKSLLYLKTLSSQWCQEHIMAHILPLEEWENQSNRQVSGGNTPQRDASKIN